SDWNHQKSQHQCFLHLIWSPDCSREKLISIIDNAQHSLKIYAQHVSDYKIVGALAKASRRGVSVEILTSGHIRDKTANYLKRAGVIIKQSNQFIIHAKVFIIDDSQAIIGSINLTQASLDDNRELSVITQDKKVVKQLNAIFDKDWKNADGWK